MCVITTLEGYGNGRNGNTDNSSAAWIEVMQFLVHSLLQNHSTGLAMAVQIFNQESAR